MERTIEVPYTALIQEHLNRNPRVIEYFADDVDPRSLAVRIESRIAIPRIVAAEARELGLPSALSTYPHE